MPWVAIQGQELARVESRLNLPVRRSGFQACMHEPSYYRHGAIVRLEAVDRKRHYIAAGDGPVSERRFFLLDGNAEAIRQGNLAAGIRIGTIAEAGSYLRFFADFLKLPDGSCIRIVDALQPGWMTEKHEEIAVAPPTLSKNKRRNVFHARAHVEWSGLLRIAEFAIRADGLVAMLEGEPLGRLVRRETH